MAEETHRPFKPALSFDSLTPLFDPVIALTAREARFKSLVLEQARLRPGETVLDLGCGTGTLAIAAAQTQPEARVIGLDADPKVLNRARSKAGKAGTQIAFDESFSTDTPYPDAHFDVVLSTLFFHHLADGDKGRTLTELLRILKPEGRLIVGDLGRPQGPLMRLAVASVQLLDGRETTSANVAGMLPTFLAESGFANVARQDRLRTPIGTLEVLTARRPAKT